MGLLDLRQNQSLLQTISGQQIQSLKLLSLGSDDLHSAVYEEVERNPALIIKSDRLESGARLRTERWNPENGTRTGTAGSGGELASNNFQAALEAHADERETLQEHLLLQLHAMRLSAVQRELCEKLIKNLDASGFHLLAPESLLDRSDPAQTSAALQHAMRTVQQLDPVGTCAANVQESLLIQARLRGNAPQFALFLLDGHLDFLSPPLPAKIVRKASAFLARQKQLFGQPQPDAYQDMPVTESSAEQALTFIRTLDPYPARNFGSGYTNFIAPDLYVQELPADGGDWHDDWEAGIVTGGGSAWQVRAAPGRVPQLALNPSFLKAREQEKLKLPAEESRMLNQNLKDAQNFIDMLAFRSSTIVQTGCLIVKLQHEFFRRGPGNLVPLRQQDIAAALGVHETTISRAANNKYIQCAWGLYEIKYFFTGAVAAVSPAATAPEAVLPPEAPVPQEMPPATDALLQDKSPLPQAASPADSSPAEQPGGAQPENSAVPGSGGAVSKDTVLHTISAILEEHRGDSKKLSDQKLSEILAERGIQVARRTVAKYRAQLHIESSYGRD